jgi:hypothetical protein
MPPRKSGVPKTGSPFALNLLEASSTKALAEGLERLHEALTTVGQVWFHVIPLFASQRCDCALTHHAAANMPG